MKTSGNWPRNGFYGKSTDALTAAYSAASEGSELPEIIQCDGATYRAMGGEIPDELLGAWLQVSVDGLTMLRRGN